MGWFWPSSKDASNSPHGASAQSRSSSRPTPDMTQTTQAPAKTYEEQADAELQAFLEEINYKPAAYLSSSLAPTDSKESTSLSPPPTQATTISQTNFTNLPSKNISPAHLYPTSMSCRTAFDAAYHCQLPGGQFVNVYRYGTLRDCRALWGDFWFCMRTNRGYVSEEERAKRIKMHYWEKERKYREGQSSEDVWDIRKEKVEGGFSGDWASAEEALRQQEAAMKEN